eukprot:3492778-Pyramimonas_sp.AAC.1
MVCRMITSYQRQRCSRFPDATLSRGCPFIFRNSPQSAGSRGSERGTPPARARAPSAIVARLVY